VPAIRPDVAVIHALKADRAGNVLIEGIVGVQKEAVLAAQRSLVTVEEIVEEFGPRTPNAVILPSWTVDAIACVPGGAHPSYAHGYYKRDNAYYKAWDAISRDRDGFLAWMKTHVLEQGPDAFAVHAGLVFRPSETELTCPGRASAPQCASESRDPKPV
jgi:glutaconate CoA-transferase, subunit A